MPIAKDIPKVLIEFRGAADLFPSLPEVKQQFGLADNEIDDAYGVRLGERGTDNPRRLFFIYATRDAAARVAQGTKDPSVRTWPNVSPAPASAPASAPAA